MTHDALDIMVNTSLVRQPVFNGFQQFPWEVGQYLKTSEIIKEIRMPSVKCHDIPQAVVIIINANGMHPTFFGRRPNILSYSIFTEVSDKLSKCIPTLHEYVVVLSTHDVL